MTPAGQLLQEGYHFHQTGDFLRAEQICRQLVQVEPANALAWSLLGAACAALGKLGEATASFQEAIQVKPDYLEAYNNLSILLTSQGRLEEAVATLHQALRLRPEAADTLNHLGVARAAQGRFDEALASYREALRLRPDYVEAHNNLGILFLSRGRYEEAEVSFQQALLLRPSFVEALTNRGNARAHRGAYDEASADFRQALVLRPDYGAAHVGLGSALGRLGRLEEASACYRHALQVNPRDVEAHYNLATVLLLMANLKDGWAEYEWRRLRAGAVKRNFTQPEWDGSELAGRTILLHAEQGLGDTIQFLRYAPLVKQRGGTVVVECQPALVPLLTGCRDVDLLVPRRAALPAFDVHAPLLSLPRILGTTFATVPAEVPYLVADPELVEHWRKELGDAGTFKIGIAWQGDPKHSEDRNRSIPLEHFEPLAQVPGVRLVSLQKGPGVEQLAALADRLPVIDLGGRLDEATGPFLDTAAAMKNLDLVITCDSALAHLAGALAVPVWVALMVIGDWRWLLHRADSPWYPTMRLFRQRRWGDWPEVFARMADALRQQRAASRPARLEAEIAAGELIDKITILEIKRDRLSDAAKLRNVRLELETLIAARDGALQPSEELARLTADLKAINETLWQVEDDLRACERQQDFGPRFVELARAVYRNNDRRAALKRQINELVGSALVEEKSYEQYE
jgi:Flp pilus assembly protein TadD